MHFLVLLSFLVSCAAGVPLNSTNPRIGTRILGGVKKEISEIPYQLALMTSNYKFSCGGVIISDKWALTAAHCVENSQAEDIIVKAGSTLPIDEYDGDVYEVKTIIPNAYYKPDSPDYDIALLEMLYSFDFNSEKIKPITLKKETVCSGTAYVSGYGPDWESIEDGIENDGTSDDLENRVDFALYEGSTKLIPLLECWDLHINNFRVTQRMICARDPRKGRRLADGDSGGPLVYGDPPQLIGIASSSYNSKTAPYPEIFMRISNYLMWIRQKTGLRL